MKIDLDGARYYYLTHDSQVRKDHMMSEFKGYDLVEVNPVSGITRNQSGNTGFSKIFDLACQHQERDKPFQPFVVLEDDVKKARDFPSSIVIPDDADVLYIGISRCGMNASGWCYTVYKTSVDPDLIRVYNMLSSHGIVVCSMRGLLSLQKCVFEDYFRDRGWDISMACIQPYLNVYALKSPLVYQYGEIGGQEEETRINYTDADDEPIPHECVNTTNVSVITTVR